MESCVRLGQLILRASAACQSFSLQQDTLKDSISLRLVGRERLIRANISCFVSQKRPGRNRRHSSTCLSKSCVGRMNKEDVEGRRAAFWTPCLFPSQATYPVQHVCPALHGDALEHCQHGEGKVVEVGDAVLGPIPPGLAHSAILALSSVARLQSTRGRIIFCWNILNGQRKREGSRGRERKKEKEVREESDRIRLMG